MQLAPKTFRQRVALSSLEEPVCCWGQQLSLLQPQAWESQEAPPVCPPPTQGVPAVFSSGALTGTPYSPPVSPRAPAAFLLLPVPRWGDGGR